jgi:acetyltransferase-like isoleucine patch superfamily enzyme
MIHETAIVGERVKLGSNVTVGAFTIIENETQIGDDSVIGSHCHIGYANSPRQAAKLMIGKRAVIRSHSVLYSGSVFGDDLTTGHRVTIREQTIANDGLQVGTLSDIQGHCSIGRYCKFHSNVHIGRQSSIEDYVWIFPYVVLTNDPHPPSEFQVGCTIRKFAAIATMSVVLPGVTVGEGALIGAQTLVREDVPDNFICVGNPGKLLGETSKIKLRDSGLLAYPWRRHFHRGYPQNVVDQWKKEFPES